jgi:hypothetical protein
MILPTKLYGQERLTAVRDNKASGGISLQVCLRKNPKFEVGRLFRCRCSR